MAVAFLPALFDRVEAAWDDRRRRRRGEVEIHRRVVGAFCLRSLGSCSLLFDSCCSSFVCGFLFAVMRGERMRQHGEGKLCCFLGWVESEDKSERLVLIPTLRISPREMLPIHFTGVSSPQLTNHVVCQKITTSSIISSLPTTKPAYKLLADHLGMTALAWFDHTTSGRSSTTFSCSWARRAELFLHLYFAVEQKVC